jgi:hypothetical protein
MIFVMDLGRNSLLDSHKTLRRAVDGTVIEHTIQLGPSSKSFAAQPTPMTGEEDTEMIVPLDVLLAKD